MPATKKATRSRPAHNTYNKVVSRLGAKSTKELDAVMCRRPSAPNPLSVTGQMFNNCRRHPPWWHFEVPLQEMLSQCDKSYFNIVFSLGNQSEMLLWLLIFIPIFLSQTLPVFRGLCIKCNVSTIPCNGGHLSKTTRHNVQTFATEIFHLKCHR